MGHVTVHNVRLAAGVRTLLEHVNFEVRPGELLAIVGANGAGKTTLLRAIAGFVPVAAGAVLHDGRDVHALTGPERARSLTLIGDDVETPHGMSVRDVVMTGRFAHRRWWDWITGEADIFAAQGALARVDLASLGERSFDSLSSGERQRAWIALALAQDAGTLLLDEPTSHLDLRVSHQILALLRELARAGKTVVCAIHDVNDAAAYADRIALLGDGRLAALDTPDRVLISGVLETTYGVAMERVRLAGGGIRVFARDA